MVLFPGNIFLRPHGPFEVVARYLRDPPEDENGDEGVDFNYDIQRENFDFVNNAIDPLNRNTTQLAIRLYHDFHQENPSFRRRPLNPVVPYRFSGRILRQGFNRGR